jgi:hypothetical protein
MLRECTWGGFYPPLSKGGRGGFLVQARRGNPPFPPFSKGGFSAIFRITLGLGSKIRKQGIIQADGHPGGNGPFRQSAASTAGRDHTTDLKKRGCHPFWLQPRRVSFSMPNLERTGVPWHWLIRPLNVIYHDRTNGNFLEICRRLVRLGPLSNNLHGHGLLLSLIPLLVFNHDKNRSRYILLS